MEIEFLRHFSFPPRLIQSLRTHYGDYFLPLQEKVIQEGRLFENENLLICSPTSSGKTFLSEILFLFHVLKGKNSVLLVPSKALANQRFKQLNGRYGPLGYDIVLSTRDHPFHDRQIVEGRFHLAVIVYEKFRALLAQNSSFIANTGSCVIDEIHYLFHPARGADLELLLTRLRDESTLQMIGLSAVVSGARIAKWMNARLILEQKRPVELRQGVLCMGHFTYREFNSGEKGVESLFESDSSDEGEAMLEAARHFAKQGETALLFWPMRSHCYTAARKLADSYDPEDDFDIPELESLEPSAMRDFLSYLLPRRIAIHTSDLSPRERELVENMARKGDIMILCATSTLAEGINFPVVNVITTQRMYASRPQDIQHGRPPAALPISHDQLWNMIGRAGRHGMSTFGRGLIITTSPGDVDGLLSVYMDSESPSQQPVLHQISCSELILKTMGYYGPFTLESCQHIVSQTLSSSFGMLPDSFSENLERTCRFLTEKGYLSEEQGIYYPAPLGNLVMKNGLSELSAQRLVQYVLSRNSEMFFPLDEIVFVCSLQEMDEVYLSVTRSDMQSHTWSRAVENLASQEGLDDRSYVLQTISEPSRLRKEHHSAFKKALILYDWIHGESVTGIEKRYRVYSGMIRRITEEASWLLGCMADIAAAHALDNAWIGHLFTVKDCAAYGLPQEGLSWNSWIRHQTLTRSDVLRLIQSGFHSPASLKREDKEYLSEFLTGEKIEALLVHAETREADKPLSTAEPAKWTVALINGRTDRIFVDGKKVTLTPLQSLLFHTLARKPGICVEYDELLDAMWPQSDGEKKQISRQKSLILKKIQKTTSKPVEDLIESIPGQGLILHAEIPGNK